MRTIVIIYYVLMSYTIVLSHIRFNKPFLVSNNNKFRKIIFKLFRNANESLYNNLSKISSIASTRSNQIISYIVNFSNKTTVSDDYSFEDIDFFCKLEDDNKQAMNVLRNLYNQLDGWSLVANKGNITVERKFLKAGSFVNKDDADKGGKHACVKSSAIINGKPEDIFNLFLDIHRIHEYNEHVSSVKDVHYFKTNRKFIVLESNDRNSSAYTSEKKSDFALGLNSDTDSSKMSYATGYRMGPFKARDFLSIVNFVKFPDNSYVILNRPAYFSKLQPNKKYVRATILLAGNIIEPYGDNKSLLTLIAHVNPGGGADTSAGAWIINKLCALGPPKFIKAVEKAVNK